MTLATTPQPNPTDDLEAVARIVDPAAWAFYDRHIESPVMGVECRNEVQVSLSRARRIAALSAPAPQGIGREADFQSVAMWMGFSASMIKSGEGWSEQCQQHFDEAKAVYGRLALLPTEPPAQEEG